MSSSGASLVPAGPQQPMMASSMAWLPPSVTWLCRLAVSNPLAAMMLRNAWLVSSSPTVVVYWTTPSANAPPF